MDINLQENFNHHMSVVRALGHDVQLEAFHGTIRALLTTIQIARKQKFRLTEPPGLLSTTEALMKDAKFPIDLAIVAGKIYCYTKVHIKEQAESIQDLLAQYSETKGTIPKICFLSGIVDCLPSDRCDTDLTLVVEEILQLLYTYNTLYYYQMRLLYAWLQHVRSIAHSIPSSHYVRAKLLLPQSAIVELINLHWETPALQCLPEQCLSTICEIWRIFFPHSQYADITAKMTLTNYTWKSKTKYLILATLLPFTHFSEILCEYPDTIYAMTASLDINSLLPAGTALFKALVKHLTPDEWEDYCQSVLLDSMNNPSKAIQQNAVQYWLPCLSHASSVVLVELKQRLMSADNFNWLAYVGLLKLTDQLEDQDRALLHRALSHGEEEVRAAAFGLLLHSNKKIEIIRVEEWKLLTGFLQTNMHSDNPQFRLKILSTIRLFLIRVLESCLNRMKTNDSIDQDIENLRYLHDHLLKSLTPMSSYQRKVIALAALRYIHQLFGSDDAQAKSLAKAANLSKRNQLIELAGERWNWTTKESLDRYTICLMGEVNDVRQKAAEMLRDFFPCPPPEYVQILYSHGLELCDNAKFQRSECGATILQLISHWTSTDDTIVPGLTVEFLITEIQYRFDRLKMDWLAGAAREPIHGFVGALAKVLQLPRHQKWISSYKELIALAQTISCYMLDTLASRSTGSPDMAPSFEEMSQSIDDIVHRSDPSLVVDTISINVQQQLVLACAWLNLKETGNLAVQLATLLINDQTLAREEQHDLVERCSQIVYQILLRCRHKGAIEAAGDAIGLLCRRLFASSNQMIRAIPGNLLTHFLQRLEHQKTGASITRRSAGLAFLVGKIVSSQPEKFTTDSLLAIATRRLISVAQRPVELSDHEDDLCDLPQSVAMHLLKSLVHDASLSVGLQPELMEPIVKLSVDSFTHPHWSVRNAALQLHGAVIPRLIGVSSKTTSELFHKLPGLENFFMEKLTQPPEGRQLITGGLIPTLSILSRLSPGHGVDALNSRFVPPLVTLLGHPVVQVRQLAAQSLLAFVSLFKTKWMTIQLCEDAEIMAVKKSSMSALNVCVCGSSPTNSLHGCLLALFEFLGRCRDVALSVEDWEMIRKSVSALAPIEKHHSSYYIKLAVLKIFQKLPSMAGDWQFFTAYRDEAVRKLYYHQPGFGDWLRLKTELVVNHISLNCMLPAIETLLPFPNGMDMVEMALKVLKNRLARLSSSSILANTVTGFVTYYIANWQTYPSLLPVCLDFILARGAGALQESDTSLAWYIDFFLDKCIETRQLGSAVALLAIPTASAVIKETVEKSLLMEGLDRVVLRLSRCLLDASQPQESICFRSAAAASLKATGRTLLAMTNKAAETSCNLFLLVLNLIQDEEKDIRADTAFFLTDLLASLHSGPAEIPRLVQLNPNQCLLEFSHQVHHWFSAHHLIPILFQLLKDPNPVDEDVNQTSLYEREPCNFFREETQSVVFLIQVVETLASAPMTGDDDQPLELRVDVPQLLQEANQCVSRVQADPSSDATRWLFTLSVDTYSVLLRLAARLTMIALCTPSWQTDQQFCKLQGTIQSLIRQHVV